MLTLNMLKQSFLPIENKEIRILILGSLPGDKSIHEQQYYAHPQNRFWKLIQHIFNRTAPLSYPQKLDLLLENQIGLWDVCAQAKRKGSMDLDIVEEIPNDLPCFFSQHPQLQTIIFNGQKAHRVYEKHFTKSEHYQYYTLPSTSPANAQYSLEKLLQEWQHLFKKD
ncbi:DNA-deoxyinosine glycosylase [Sphingobacterium faecium]|uniref:DNA-deoxyinosine glycosylase n=1 Tax=Sphingobacterium faecium TaxID=34087 RepID=UPI0032083947